MIIASLWVTSAMLVCTILLAGWASGESPQDAVRLWNLEYPESEGAVVDVTLVPAREDETARGSITFAPGHVKDVQYQICEIGQACFAIGIPLQRDNDTWSFDTADLPKHSPLFDAPPTFVAGTRVGIQFFVHPTASDGDPLLFPKGLPETIPSFEQDFVTWSETHYFETVIQPGQKDAPSLGLVVLVVGIMLLAMVRRRN